MVQQQQRCRNANRPAAMLEGKALDSLFALNRELAASGEDRDAAGLVLGLFASILFEMSAVGPRFPFAKVLGISLSFGVIPFLYYGLLSVFVED
ncbi:MAG: hypothetical protein ACYDAH_10515 [Steroidobacteraceae bacterium]